MVWEALQTSVHVLTFAMHRDIVADPLGNLPLEMMLLVCLSQTIESTSFFLHSAIHDQICAYLGPADLLHLSLVSKSYRAFLLATEFRTLWKDAVRNAKLPVLEIPFRNPIQYISFVFGDWCMVRSLSDHLIRSAYLTVSCCRFAGEKEDLFNRGTNSEFGAVHLARTTCMSYPHPTHQC